MTPSEVRATIHALCEERNYDPFKEMISMATETQDIEVGNTTITAPLCTVDQRITIAKELAQYLAPKLKSIELSGEVDHEWSISVKKFEADAPTKTLAAPEATRNFLTEVVDESKALVKEAIKHA